jgi:hypothetical protein
MLLLRESSACSLNTPLQARAPIHLSVSVYLSSFCKFRRCLWKVRGRDKPVILFFMGRKANEVPATHLTGDEQELSCFRNTNLAPPGGGGKNYFALDSQQFYTQWTVKCNACRPVSLVSFFIFVLLRRFLWLFFCSIRIFFLPFFPFRLFNFFVCPFIFPFLCIFYYLFLLCDLFGDAKYQDHRMNACEYGALVG